MFVNPIVDINDGTVDHTYDLIRYTANGSVRRDITETYELPSRLLINHSDSGVGEKAVRRSQIEINDAVADANGNVGIIRAYMVVVVPKGQATPAQVKKTVYKLLNTMGIADGGNLNPDRLIAGEI